MTALELVKKKMTNSGLDSSETIGLSSTYQISDLDCDCVDGDCSTDGYES
ncbi:unknown [Clostridium sp. CAG:710]|nr:unknown [Clostridium sp. CAG:710]